MEEKSITIEVVIAQLTSALGIAIPKHVAEYAVSSPRYYYHLIAAKNNSEWLQMLFKLAEQNDTLNSPPSSNKLVKTFAASLVNWGLSGFTKIDEGILARRWSACQACPHLSESPDSLTYHLGRKIIARDSDHRICSLCGCFAQSKASIPSERCPSIHPLKQSMSRWDETL